jgi:hypothetical protein
MKRIKIILLSITLGLLLLTSSIMITTQATGSEGEEEYLPYDFKVIYGPVVVTSVDTIGAPQLIVIEHYVESAVECTITIDNTIYSYPEDFDIYVTHHIELNALTGEGMVRTEGNFIFKIPGQPTLTFRGISRITGFFQTQEGNLINPEEFKGQGYFQLTGTKILNKIEGFGFGDTIFNPPEYTNQYVHQMGFIKGWPL